MIRRRFEIPGSFLTQSLRLFFLFSSAGFASNLPQPGPDCGLLIAHLGQLIERPWVDAKFSNPFLRQLAPLPDSRFQSEFGIDPVTTHAAALDFRHHRPGYEPLEIRHYLTERVHPDGRRQAVILFVMRLHEEPVGFLALSFERKDGGLEAWSEYLKVDSSKAETFGMVRSFFGFTRRFYPALGVTSERLEAGWAGRPIWARMGYDFDPGMVLLENSVPCSQLEVVRNNFERFLNFHGIKREELYLEKDLGGREAIQAGFINLSTPEDFLSVRHSAGLLVEVCPYVDADTLGPASMEHPGKAFSLWDYRPRPAQTISITQDGKPLSDIAMPTWIGIFRFQSGN